MAQIAVELQKYLLMAGKKWNVEEYLLYSGIATAIAIGAIYVLFHPKWTTLGVMLFLSLAVILYAPKKMAETRAKKAEAELPYALRTIASEVEAGIAFEQALLDGAGAGKEIENAFRHALELYKKGIPMEKALTTVGESFMSDAVRRAFLHLAILYQSGKEAVAVKKMADEMISIHRAESKRFSSELAIYTLIFIAIAAVVPALFETYVMIGSFVLNMTLTPPQVFIITAVGFPLATAISLVYIYLRLPTFMRR